ncbi:MAG: hypothetical protein Q4A32_01780 [Lachnospiraceae bacterium]|nr:hypothetical protein [Lachnospiraceae bacterium]
MADLMSGTWDFEKLESQYKNFRAPALSISVGGTDLVKKGIPVQSVEAVLSLDGASSVSVVFVDCYDIKNGSFNGTLKSAAVLGKTVELSLGYQSSLQKVFKGYLSNVRVMASAESGFGMEFVALDARRLMMVGNNHARQFKIRNYSDAVSEILKTYAKLCSASIDATSDNMENGLIWQNGSDYDFITRELIGTGRTDREFFIAVDKAYFRKRKSVKSSAITLRPGKGLVSFERDASYLNQTFEVIGFDPVGDKTVSGKTKAASTDSMTSALSGPGEWFITDPACTSASVAASRTAVMAQLALDASQKAEIGCIGLPELIPGRFVSIDRVDSIVNKKYYITKVTHRFDYSGFTTTLETEGWE